MRVRHKHYILSTRPYVVVRDRRRYGVFNFLLDLFMIGITSGLWIVWILIRELRN